MGRRSNKTPEERTIDLIQAIQRSGFTGQEIVQILADWYEWQHVKINATDNVTHEITGRNHEEA